MSVPEGSSPSRPTLGERERAPTAAATLAHVRVRYRDHLALDDATVSFPRGSLVAIVGPNGAGKSTLLRALTGVVRLDAGEIHLDGASIAKLSRRAIARRVAYVPQEHEPEVDLDVRTVVSLGRYAVRGAERERAEDRSFVDRALSELDLEALAARPLRSLSGGQRQRVHLARALAQAAPLLALDEPTANLDPRNAHRAFTHLSALAHAGKTVVVAAHDLDLAARYAHRAILVSDARIQAEGPTADVLTAGRIARVFRVKTATYRDPAGRPFTRIEGA